MTVNELTYFTVEGSWYDVEAPPTSGSTNTPSFLVISAFVEFTPRLAPGTVEYITNLDLGFLLAAPSGLTVVASGTGGTLAAGAHFWVVTAVNANGETVRSNEISVTTSGSTSSAALSWNAVNGAASYNVYRGTTTTNENVLVTNVAGTSYTDTGAAGTSVTPPATNTAEASDNVAVAIAPVQARIYNGQLEVIDQANTPNVQLLANSPLLNVQQLIYDVAFTSVVYAGGAQTLTNFAFVAPTTNTTVDLGSPTLTRLPYAPNAY